MSLTLQQVQALVKQRAVLISQHGYDEMLQDDIRELDPITGIQDAIIVEDYPDHVRGPCVLVLQQDREGRPIHVVWGVRLGTTEPAVLITAYRPNPERWTADWLRRLP